MNPPLRACLLLLLAAPASGQSLPAADAWPEWRGGARQGYARIGRLPARLDPAGPTLRWKVPVRGRGISSPIVVGNRVFVTTAHRDEGGLRRAGLAVMCLSVLGLLAGAALVLRARCAGRSCRPARVDAAGVAAAACAFAALAATAGIAPDRLWTLGQPGEAWLVTGAILLLGLAAAGGCAPAGGRLRRVAAAVLVATGALLWCGVPLDRYGIEHGAAPRAWMVAPAALFALFAVWSAATARRRARGVRPRPDAALRGVRWLSDQALRGAAGGLLACAALLSFWSVNAWDRGDRLARSLLCFDLESGVPLWERVLLVASKEQKWPSNSYATPTPCSDGQRVFAYFGAGYGCVDLDGNVLWTGEDPDFAPSSRYGAGASPIVHRGQVLLWQENEMKNRRLYLLALDLATGALRWRVEPDDVHDSYATPILVPRPGGDPELVTMVYRKLVAHSTTDGSRLWELPLPARQMVPSLCCTGDGDLLLVSGGTHLEFSTSGIRLHGTGRATRPEVLWQTRRNLSDICSPVLAGGLYFTLVDGRLRCLDPETGKVHWTGRVGATDYWSSLVAGDGKLYALSGEGELTTVAVDATGFRVIATACFDEPCMATPALVEGRVLVRTERHLYCFAAEGEPRPGR